MPAAFDTGFFVHEPAWHGLGTVLEDYPGREAGMELAGHNFEVAEEPVKVRGVPIPGWKAHVKVMPGDPSDGKILHIAKESLGVVQNDTLWDIVDAIVGEGAKYETAGTLEGGAQVWVLAWLDEPVTIKGDNSPYLPFLNVNGRHDGSGALTARSTSWRVVCRNTQSAAEAEGRRLSTDYSFAHTKNVMARIEEAKMALAGVRVHHEEFIRLATELAEIKVTPGKMEDFVHTFIPMPLGADISDRVVNNIDDARAAIRSVIAGPTVPDAHKLTAYGMWLAGVEYLDHIRNYQSLETKFRRSIMRNEPAKAKLLRGIKEVVEA